jgi:predicted NAD/FAD-binding protein
MPKAKKAWASWVYSSKTNSKQDLSVTYWMNNLQAIDCH